MSPDLPDRPASPPPEAATVFGARLPLAVRLAGWLTGQGIVRGLLGPREADQIWERHLLNGVGVGTLIAPDSVVIDLGSGAGLPGLPLLLARPDLHVVLVEPRARRADFLREVCDDLGLPATVLRARATPDGLVLTPEGIRATIPSADVVTARAVASIADLGTWAAPLLRTGGRLLAVKGASAEAELERERPVLQRLGFRMIEIRRVEATGPDRDGDPPSSGTCCSAVATTVMAMTWGRVSRET